MELTVLLDNNTIIDRYFLGEPALSILIEDNKKKILFDTGYSDAFILNARKLNYNLLDLDYIVISHGHLDHTWGIDPLIRLYTEAKTEQIAYKNPIIVTHPNTFNAKHIDGIGEIGSLIKIDELMYFFKLKFSKKPIWLTHNLVYLGEIPRVNDFENKYPVGETISEGQLQDDYLQDDSALAYKTPRGIIIITGCSHSGICNIVEYAKFICKSPKVLDIIGGFHLLDSSKEYLDKTLNYLKQQKINAMHPCHCTDLKAKIALSRISDVKEVGSGLRIKYLK